MKTKKLKVAVTGSIGSGKSTFCNFIAKKDYPVIKADDISKNILKNDKDIRKKVIKEFGNESFINHEINKKFLAEKIFSDPVNVIKINSILHPEVKKEVSLLTEEHFKKHHFVFTEAALIYEADMETMFDYIVLITADENIRKNRKADSDGFSSEEFNRRNNNQIPDHEKRKRADFVFENNGSKDELKDKAELLISLLKGLSSGLPGDKQGN